jgi:hypothetical protein
MTKAPHATSHAGAPRALALRRAALRERDEGAVIFVVAMTLAVLAALGAYALTSASMEIKTAGYERQNTQTHYLSEYGVLAAMQDVSPETAQLYFNRLVDPRQRDSSCTSLPGIAVVSGNPLSSACLRMGSAELAQPWGAPAPAPLTAWSPTAPGTPGSLGIIPMDGDFYVEMTEPVPTTPPAGMGTAMGLCFFQITVTSVGITQPQLANRASHPTALYGGEGLETARARLVAGPVKGAGCGP